MEFSVVYREEGGEVLTWPVAASLLMWRWVEMEASTWVEEAGWQIGRDMVLLSKHFL